MEAARALTDVPGQLRSRRFARECEALRPLGIAYVLRHFGNRLDHADAEDAVADVVIRLHRQAEAGRPPDNLRAAFFTSCRNAAIDQLRSRSVRPTVALEVVAEAPAAEPTPEDRVESIDDAIRLREALGRMRPNYREVIVLRFGLGLTVPEIATRLAISLPAAKKRVLRATAEIRERMESIEGSQFCPEMRERARRSLFDSEVASAQDEIASAVLHAHFEHCGSCRSFLAALHDNLHELGSATAFSGYLAVRSGAVHRLADLAGRFAHGALAKARLALFKATGAFQPDGAGSAGALTSTTQKLAAICTAGAATTATCLATGIVGPGIGVVSTPPAQISHPHPPAKLSAASRQMAKASSAPAQLAPPPATNSSTQTSSTHSASRSSSKANAAESKASASTKSKPEFGFEAPTPPPAPAPVPQASASSSAPTPSSSSASSSSAGSSKKGSESFGFNG
jgi:RNA polymerase sigma-70 factor, ECF subfamily